jgi:hypothetical protein
LDGTLLLVDHRPPGPVAPVCRAAAPLTARCIQTAPRRGPRPCRPSVAAQMGHTERMAARRTLAPRMSGCCQHCTFLLPCAMRRLRRRRQPWHGPTLLGTRPDIRVGKKRCVTRMPCLHVVCLHELPKRCMPRSPMRACLHPSPRTPTESHSCKPLHHDPAHSLPASRQACGLHLLAWADPAAAAAAVGSKRPRGRPKGVKDSRPRR